jgi:alanine-alpha-ketoisovalerate/valine-pyruvate aminotransferase
MKPFITEEQVDKVRAAGVSEETIQQWLKNRPKESAKVDIKGTVYTDDTDWVMAHPEEAHKKWLWLTAGTVVVTRKHAA